ncbi:hypothetical protein L228DRAFT_271204 [Xylona heveae TC161]|uniref:Protein BCP1 n=1 Tax=Xylona heveae (strain CBS 132557 / TC161) TaxID=1328760 RepID=A0A164ZQR8_XYLHT|nr:hypothetical protein L228DRAFT_271204 [Xylona heveae TC161]KZF19390.1 hypothetical protein L228DRAFT_271204 [Xylona heveae TC161]
MAKRKQIKDEEMRDAGSDDRVRNDSDESGSDEDTEMVNVEFEWFDPHPDHDFHGIKTLLRQLFDNDALLFDLSALTDLILAQPLLGSTVKVDGQETDPYAFLSVLNLHEHQNKPVVKDLTNYLAQKSSANANLSNISSALSSSDARVGLILTERLINIPSEVVPPMYSMLLEEISWALEEKEPYDFTHYLIISKTYTEVESKLDQEDDRPQKKKKGSKNSNEIFFFHPEDEVLQKHAMGHGGFEYTNQSGEGVSDSKRVFQDLGIRPQGHMMLIEASKFSGAINAISEYLNPSSI